MFYLRAARESIDRFWPNKHLTMDILVYVNARAHTRKNSLRAYLSIKFYILQYACNTSQLPVVQNNFLNSYFFDFKRICYEICTAKENINSV